MPGPGEVIDEYRPLDTEALGKGASMRQLLLLATVRREMLAGVRLPRVEEDGADSARRVVSRQVVERWRRQRAERSGQ
jgi:hypothetical protein